MGTNFVNPAILLPGHSDELVRKQDYRYTCISQTPGISSVANKPMTQCEINHIINHHSLKFSSPSNQISQGKL